MKFIFILSLFSILFVILNAIDVKTSSGLVRGTTITVLNKSIDQFLGIPFAEPPLGSLRFRKPKPLEKPIEVGDLFKIILLLKYDLSSKGIIDATKKKYSCIQPERDYVGKVTIGEDCLVLNILAPKSENKTDLKPVMFWIFGGTLLAGSIFQDNTNGIVLATHDVVIVAANYRVGALGFLYSGDESAPGNVGFHDQVLALKWV